MIHECALYLRPHPSFVLALQPILSMHLLHLVIHLNLRIQKGVTQHAVGRNALSGGRRGALAVLIRVSLPGLRCEAEPRGGRFGAGGGSAFHIPEVSRSEAAWRAPQVGLVRQPDSGFQGIVARPLARCTDDGGRPPREGRRPARDG